MPVQLDNKSSEQQSNAQIINDNGAREIERLDKELEKELENRDRNADYADQLTNMVGVLLGQDMGEHTSENEPWENAIEALRVAIGSKQSPEEPKAHLATDCHYPDCIGDCQVICKARHSSPEKAAAPHTTEQDFQHWLSYSGIASASEADLRAAFYAGANAAPPHANDASEPLGRPHAPVGGSGASPLAGTPAKASRELCNCLHGVCMGPDHTDKLCRAESGTPHGEAGDRAGPRVSPVDISYLRQRMAELAGSLQHELEKEAEPERWYKIGSLLSQLGELQKQTVVRPENGGGKQT